MKLAAIINVFGDSVELLPYCLNCLVGEVDEIVFVTQDVSNYGERIDYELFSEGFLEKTFSNTIFTYVKFTPNLKLKGNLGMQNETTKRQLGLEVAKSGGCTHFLHLDCDEMYEDFGAAKKQFFNSGAKGSVAMMWTYFKLPTLRFEKPDNYFVPFIFELRSDSTVGNNPLILNGTTVICDPTRKPNQQEVVLIIEPMHHYSWVRKDIMMKVRNSSAQANIANSNRLQDYMNPDIGPGFYSKDYDQKLISVPNIFGIEL